MSDEGIETIRWIRPGESGDEAMIDTAVAPKVAAVAPDVADLLTAPVDAFVPAWMTGPEAVASAFGAASPPLWIALLIAVLVLAGGFAARCATGWLVSGLGLVLAAMLMLRDAADPLLPVVLAGTLALLALVRDARRQREEQARVMAAMSDARTEMRDYLAMLDARARAFDTARGAARPAVDMRRIDDGGPGREPDGAGRDA